MLYVCERTIFHIRFIKKFKFVLFLVFFPFNYISTFNNCFGYRFLRPKRNDQILCIKLSLKKFCKHSLPQSVTKNIGMHKIFLFGEVNNLCVKMIRPHLYVFKIRRE